MPRLVVLAAVLAGCYSPKLGSPGFYCHEADNPACPADQVCVGGQCVDKAAALHFDLAGVTDGPASQDDQGGGSHDLAGGKMDLSKPADLSVKDSNGGPCGLKINELQTAGAGGAADEYIELYNSCSTSISISGYRLTYRSAAGTTDVDFLTFGSVSVGATSFFLCGGSLYTGSTDAKYTASSMAASGGGVAIFDGSGTLVDSVGYGTATNSFVKGSPAPAPGTAQSIGRLPDGNDSGNNASDFTLNAMPTPRAANQ